MKTIILKCDDGYRKPRRYLIEYDECTGEAQIVDEKAPRVDRDRSAVFTTDNGLDFDHKDFESYPITLTVEAA